MGVTENGMRWRLWKVEVDGVNSGGSRGGEEVGGDGGQRGSMPVLLKRVLGGLITWASKKKVGGGLVFIWYGFGFGFSLN